MFNEVNDEVGHYLGNVLFANKDFNVTKRNNVSAAFLLILQYKYLDHFMTCILEF